MQPFIASFGPTKLTYVVVACDLILEKMQLKCLQKLKCLVDNTDFLMLHRQNQLAILKTYKTMPIVIIVQTVVYQLAEKIESFILTLHNSSKS